MPFRDECPRECRPQSPASFEAASMGEIRKETNQKPTPAFRVTKKTSVFLHLYSINPLAGSRVIQAIARGPPRPVNNQKQKFKKKAINWKSQ